MSNVSDAELADGVSEPEFAKASIKEEKNDEQLHLHDIEHLSEDIKNKISSAGLSGLTFVDDLFKTFLAKKMEDIESEHKKQKKKKSSKGKKDAEDGSKSRKHKHKKKKHKSKSSRNKSRDKVSSDCEPDSKADCESSRDSDVLGKSDLGSNSGSKSSRHSKLDRASEKSRLGSKEDHHGSKDDHHGSKDDHHGSKDDHHGSKDDHRGSKDDHHGSKDDHRGSKDDHHGSKDDHHGSKDDHRGSKDDHHGSKDDHRGSKEDHHGSKDDHHHRSKDDHRGSNAGSNASRHSKFNQRSGRDCRDSNAGHERDDADHSSDEKTPIIEDSNTDKLRTSFGIEITESNQTIKREIKSAVDVTDTIDLQKVKIEAAAETEEQVFVKPLLEDFEDFQERICKSEVGDANSQQNDFRKVDSAQSQIDHSESCKISEHIVVKKEFPDPCDDLYPVSFLVESETGVSQVITGVLETDKDHRNSLNLWTDGVHGSGLVGNEKLTSDDRKDSEEHENRTDDQIQSKALDSKPLSSQEAENFSTDKSKDPTRQSKDRSRKSKDRKRHSSSRTKDHPGKSSTKSKSSSERKHDTSRSMDRDKKSKDRGDHSKDRKSQSKDNCSRSKDHERSSRDHDSRSKDRERLLGDHDNASKDLGDLLKDHEKRSGDHDSQSKDGQRQSRDRDNQSKADETYSRDHKRQSRDRDSQSRDNDVRSMKRSSEKDIDKTKSSSEKNRDRSQSSDHGRRSKDHDRSSKDHDRSSKDHDWSSKDHDRSSKDRRIQSKDRFIAHTSSQVDRANSRSKRSPSERRNDRSRSVEILNRSRSKSFDRTRRKRSRESSVIDVDSDGARRVRQRLKSKSKQKSRRKRREKSVEIIEDDDDDDEMESPEASEKLTERLLKRLNTSIKRGQELKGEKDARLDPTMSSGVGMEEPEEVGCGDEDETREGRGIKILDADVSACGEVFSSVAAVSAVDVSGVAVSSVGVSGGNCLGVSTLVQGAVAETGGQGEKAVVVTTKPGLGKMRKTMMKMGIRLTETSMAIISSGVMMEAEQKVNAEDDEGHGLCAIKSEGLVGEPGDSTSVCLPKQSDKNLTAETISKTDLENAAVKGDGWLKQDADDGGRSTGQKETNLKSESRKRRHSRSRSRERGAKKGRDNRGRDMSPAKKSESRTKDADRRSRSHARSRKSRSRSKNRRRKSRSRSTDRRRKSRSRSNDRRRKSKSREKRRTSRSQSGDRRQGRRRGRSRSPVTEEKSQVDLRLKIDKARLREIAIKKVYGNGPVFDMKPEEVVAFRSGGKSVEELTDFCKRIAEKEKNQLGESPSPEVERPASDDEDMPFTANAFKARELTNSIVLNIRNSRPLPVFSSQEKIAKAAELRTQFPVSSGTQHRAKEWVPVEKTQQTTGSAAPGPSTGNPAPPGSVEEQPVVAEDKVFPDPPSKQIDVGQVVSERLSALRKLQTNPHDVQALGNVFKAQQKMQQWAASKQLPGQFLGSTGLNTLSQKDIFNHNPRNQAWVKKDTFTRAPPLDSGIGKLLLQRMGWKEGEGLGKNNEGMKLPLMVDIKMDRKGLTTEEENGRRGRPGIVAAAPIRFDFSGKHPVSALNEICTKRKWNMPNFILMEETGPSHSKTFRFKVEVNNVEYVPLTTSSTKKTAKLEAATVCLQQLGLLPRS